MVRKQFGQLYIQKRSFPQWLTLFIFVMPFLLGMLQQFFGVPGVIKYTIDVAWVLVLFMLLLQRRAVLHKATTPFLLLVVGLFLYAFVCYLFRFQSPFYFLWGFRNNFRLYVAFFAFATFFDEDGAVGGLKLMDFLFWVNALLSFYQYFVLGLQWDYLGGIFGTEVGCNAYSIIFFGVVISHTVLRFMNRQEGAFWCFLKCGVSLVIAAIAELKVYFVLFIVILVVAAVITRFSWRKLLLICVASVLFSFASALLSAIFGEQSAITLERVLELITATSYSTAEDISRFTALPVISRSIFETTADRLFGLGLGNCDTSAFAICNTPFFQTYSYLHYSWFSSAFLFLETGYVGLTLHLLFYVLCFFAARKRLKNGSGNELFCQLGMIMSILCVILTFYNSSLRTETGYIAFFALALPFVGGAARMDEETG